MGETAFALIAYAAWFIVLTLVMGFYRISVVLTGEKAVNTFAVDGSDHGPLGFRLTRARDNCYETLPAFAAIVLGAFIVGRFDITDPQAMWVLYARLAQSVMHIVSTSVVAVWVRATFFSVQMLIYLYWCIRLLG